MLSFNSLIGKIEIVIKVWLGISFGHGGAHFLTQSTCLTQTSTFPKFQVINLSLKSKKSPKIIFIN